MTLCIFYNKISLSECSSITLQVINYNLLAQQRWAIPTPIWNRSRNRNHLFFSQLESEPESESEQRTGIGIGAGIMHYGVSL